MLVSNTMQDLIFTLREDGSGQFVPTRDDELCCSILRDVEAMTGLLEFLFAHGSLRPSAQWSDLEWAGAR